MQKNNNQGTQKPQQPQQQPIHEQGDYQKRSTPDGRTTTTNQKPSPGPKK